MPDESRNKALYDDIDRCARLAYDATLRELLPKLRAALSDLEQESNYQADLCDRMEKVLDRVVNIVRGEPPAGTVWGWHDLPERVCNLCIELKVAQNFHSLAVKERNHEILKVERLQNELAAAYAEIRKQIHSSKVVFDRDVVERAQARGDS